MKTTTQDFYDFMDGYCCAFDKEDRAWLERCEEGVKAWNKATGDCKNPHNGALEWKDFTNSLDHSCFICRDRERREYAIENCKDYGCLPCGCFSTISCSWTVEYESQWGLIREEFKSTHAIKPETIRERFIVEHPTCKIVRIVPSSRLKI